MFHQWHSLEKKQSRKVMKSFKQYITEAKKLRVKGWGHKSGKLVMTPIVGQYKPYHSQFLVNNLGKFGLKEKDIIDVLKDKHGDIPSAEKFFDRLSSGKADRDSDITNYMEELGWHSVVVDSGNNAIEGAMHNKKAIHKIAKALDKKYGADAIFPDNSAYIELGIDEIYNKFDWKYYIKTGKFSSGRTEIGQTMAQFREAKQQPTEYVLWGVPPGEREEVLVLDAPGGKPITKLSDAKKYKKVLEKEHGVKKIRIQTIDFSQDLSKMFSGKNIVR